MWRTTGFFAAVHLDGAISIHVLRVEDDILQRLQTHGTINFNPRPPCGGRQKDKSPLVLAHEFQSTSSVWRTTHLRHHPNTAASISIHVLRVEDDGFFAAVHLDGGYFNPRPPCGGRPEVRRNATFASVFQSTSSVWRTTLRPETLFGPKFISIHVLRVEDDPC